MVRRLSYRRGVVCNQPFHGCFQGMRGFSILAATLLEIVQGYGKGGCAVMTSRILAWGISLTLVLWLGLPSVAGAAQDADAHRFGVFWQQFSRAVVEDQRERVADLTQLPFLLDGSEHDRSAFLREYPTLFTPAMRRCFKKITPVHDLDGYSVVCGEQIFVFGLVNGRYRFTEIGVND